jgi:hypothetical protein
VGLQLRQPGIGREQGQANGFGTELSQMAGLDLGQFPVQEFIEKRLKLGLFRCGAYRPLSIMPSAIAQS